MIVKLTPVEVESMTGVSPEVLRNWRTRGFMHSLGTQQPNGRWVYSASDAMTIWVMSQMASVGMSNSAAMMGAEIITSNILRDFHGFRGLRGADPASLPSGSEVPLRYFVAYLEGEWVFFEDMKVDRVKVGVPGGYIFDQWEIAKTLPQGVVDYVQNEVEETAHTLEKAARVVGGED